MSPCPMVVSQPLNQIKKYGVSVSGLITGLFSACSTVVSGKSVRCCKRSEADMISFTSEQNYYIYPEPISYGVKVLVSDIPANKEIGLPDSDYFHCGNVKELASKLYQVITHPLERLEYDMSKYDRDKIADQTVEVYKGMKK
jgi:glycosyltransferase involved in cell wall biosynthesis